MKKHHERNESKRAMASMSMLVDWRVFQGRAEHVQTSLNGAGNCPTSFNLLNV